MNLTISLTMKTKRDNIAEYILHLWQMEDVVRAFADDEALQQNAFLADLKAMMQQEGVMQSGHVSIARLAVGEMEDLHSELLNEVATYRAAYMQLIPQLALLKSKSDNPTQSDIQMMLVFLYSLLLLRLQKKEISVETQQTEQQVSHLLAYLSKAYKESAE